MSAGGAPAEVRRGRRRGSRQVQTAWTDVTRLDTADRVRKPAIKRAVLAVGGIAIAVAAAFVLQGADYELRRLTLALIALIIACGLNILVGHTGQVSLGHVALYAVGGYTAAWVTTYLHWPPLTGVPVAAVAAGVAGLLVGAPALRLRGAYLALATMAFGLIVYKTTDSMRQVAPKLAEVRPPSITNVSLPLTINQQLYLMALLVAVIVLWITRSVTWSSTGRSLMAVRDSEDGAASIGISVYKMKLGAFFASAVIAGVAGALYNYVDTYINPSTFETVQSIRFLFVLVIGGLGTAIAGPAVGAVLIFVLQLFAEQYQQAENLALAAVLLAIVWFLPRGIAGTIGQTRLGRWLPPPYETFTVLSRTEARLPVLDGETDLKAGPHVQARGPAHRHEAPPTGEPVLILDNVVKRYGGITAVDHVSISVPDGSIHAIMGPNGSGKTTCLDMIAGVRQPDEGRVIINGVDVSGLPPHKREQAGLARTFQNIQLFKELPVIWNVAAAIPPRSHLWQRILRTPKSVDDEIRIHGEALSILEEWDLAYLTFRKAGVCSYGQQKMIELARAAATKPKLLLVDEPSTGLNPKWIEGMVQALANINAAGTTLLLVEHHQAVIGDLADRVTVLDQGAVIAEGTFDEVRNTPQVQIVYLGEVHKQPPPQPGSQSRPAPPGAHRGGPDGHS